MGTRVFITGAAGQLGRELIEVLGGRGCDLILSDAPAVVAGVGVEIPDLRPVDLRDRGAVANALAEAGPDVVIHAAAFTAVDRCESEPELAREVNVDGTRWVAEGARAVGARVLYISTDYVFDGTKSGPYIETDEPNPRSVYGQTKLGGERVLDEGSTVVRTSWLCGRHGPNMVKTILRLAGSEPTLRFVDDQVGHPTIAADLARVVADLVEAGHTGIFHATNQGAVSWYEFARSVLRAAGHDPDRVQPCKTHDLVPPRPAARPANSVLSNERLRSVGVEPAPDFRESLPILLADLRR